MRRRAPPAKWAPATTAQPPFIRGLNSSLCWLNVSTFRGIFVVIVLNLVHIHILVLILIQYLVLGCQVCRVDSVTNRARIVPTIGRVSAPATQYTVDGSCVCADSSACGPPSHTASNRG